MAQCWGRHDRRRDVAMAGVRGRHRHRDVATWHGAVEVIGVVVVMVIEVVVVTVRGGGGEGKSGGGGIFVVVTWRCGKLESLSSR